MAELGDGAGFVVLSTGADRKPLLWECLASIKRHYPTAPVHVVTDVPLDAPYSLTWVRGGAGLDSRRYKTRIGQFSPFDISVLIDDDTVIHQPFGKAELALRNAQGKTWDIAMARDGGFATLGEYKARGKGGAFVKAAQDAIQPQHESLPYFSSGVIIWRAGKASSGLFQSWFDHWLPYQERDQQPLIQAILQTGIDVAVLPREMNFIPERWAVGKRYPDIQANVIHFWKNKVQAATQYPQQMGFDPGPRPPLAYVIDHVSAPGQAQMTPDQYRAIGVCVADMAPCNLLVFGCGRDSLLWQELNRGGTTRFVESSPEWIAKARASGVRDVVHCDYPTRRGVPSSMLVAPDMIRRTNWDMVVIDGPAGCGHDSPGRQLPIHWAYKMLNNDGHPPPVFVHDWQRPWDHQLCERTFDTPDLVIYGDGKRGDLALWRGERRRMANLIHGIF